MRYVDVPKLLNPPHSNRRRRPGLVEMQGVVSATASAMTIVKAIASMQSIRTRDT